MRSHQMKCVLNSQALAVRKSEIACEMQNPNEVEMSLKLAKQAKFLINVSNQVGTAAEKCIV